MKKPETLAQLICRTVLEFEQRQVLQRDKLRDNASKPAIINTSKQTTSQHKSA